MNSEIKETKVLSEEEQVSQILENLPGETESEISVPSGGYSYFKGKAGLIKLKPIRFGDEKELAMGNRGPNFNPANFLLAKCVSNVDVDDLLLIDKLYLLLKIREISYGNEYEVGVGCTACGHENKLNLHIDQLDSVDIPEDMDLFNIPVHLKGIGKDAIVTAPLVSEEDFLAPQSIQTNLWRFVKSIAGNNSPAVISKVIQELPLVDVHTLINAFSLEKFGIQPKIKYTCDGCTHLNLISLPIDENFFSVS
tara:strand:- start:616 stop:1371 length:756 start_codon:yes stop_codon:yes gene_type:complete